MNTQELENVLDTVLAPAGFRRRKETWYRTNEDTIILVNLQKSRWGGQYYVNLAVYLRDLGKATSPLEHQAHIRVRLTSIAQDRGVALDEALNLERSAITAAQRTSTIAEVMATVALPFLAERSVVPRLRSLHAEGRLGPVMMVRVARELLEASPA